MPELNPLMTSNVSNGLLNIASPSQYGRLLTLTSHADDSPLHKVVIERFSGQEGINTLDTFRIDTLCTDACFDPAALIGQELTLGLRLGDGSRRLWHGLLTNCSALGGDGGLARHRLVLQPWLAQLGLRRDSYVFTRQTVLDTVAEVLADYPLCSYAVQVSRKLPVFATRVQYRESDLAFVQRILAEAGLNYRLEHEQHPGQTDMGSVKTRHTLIIFDADAKAPECALNPIRFHRADATERTDSFTHWRSQRHVITNQIHLGAWDAAQLAATQAEQVSARQLGEQAPLEEYDVHGSQRYADSEHAQADALLQLLRHESAAKHYQAQGTVRCLAPGQEFELSQHDRYGSEHTERRYVALHLTHEAANNLGANAARVLHDADIEQGTYRNQVHLQDAAGAIVPPPLPKPAAPDVLSALVIDDALPDSANTHVHSNRDHQVKVRLFWQPQGDTTPNNADPARIASARSHAHAPSVWLRVMSPAAGPNWGAHLLPRVGTEVALEFMEGDIDRPFVAGQLHTAQDLPAWSAGQNSDANHPGSLSGWHTRSLDGSGYNEWQTDDTPAQVRTRLASSHSASQLNLGHLINIAPDSSRRSAWRGTGAELRSDAWTAVRAGDGLLLSTVAQEQATGPLMQAQGITAQLRAAQQTAQRMHSAIEQAQGVPLKGNDVLPSLIEDTNPADNGRYPDAVNGQDTRIPAPGQRTGDQPLPAVARPIVVMDAINSLNVATPASAAVFAGQALHWTSHKDAHTAAGHTLSLAAAGSVGLHSADGGLRAIAQDGLVSVQAHQGEQAWTAQQAITITSSNNAIEILAPGKITLNGASTAITLDGTDITLAMPAELDIKGAKHSFVGPGADAAQVPDLPVLTIQPTSGRFHRKFVATWAGTDIPAVNTRYQIFNSKGELLVEGRSDDAGETDLSINDMPDDLTIQLLRD